MQKLYIYLFLHQTTTVVQPLTKAGSCISIYSYIKPQPSSHRGLSYRVVYLSIPTSNHNRHPQSICAQELYIYLFLHQTTTYDILYILSFCCISIYSYIKPQLVDEQSLREVGCISIYSYIKPQPDGWLDFFEEGCISIYSYIKPQLHCTSNLCKTCCISIYSYIKPQR